MQQLQEYEYLIYFQTISFSTRNELLCARAVYQGQAMMTAWIALLIHNETKHK